MPWHTKNKKGHLVGKPKILDLSSSWISCVSWVASGPITSWKIDGETVETVSDFTYLGSKITADDDCSHEIKRHLLLGRKVMTNQPTQHIKKQRHGRRSLASYSPWSRKESDTTEWLPFTFIHLLSVLLTKIFGVVIDSFLPYLISNSFRNPICITLKICLHLLQWPWHCIWSIESCLSLLTLSTPP